MSKVKVLAIDPAFSAAGVSILECEDGKIDITHSFTIRPGHEAGLVRYRDSVTKFGKHAVAVNLLAKQLKEIYEHHRPDVVVIEDAFFLAIRPAAFASVLRFIHAVEYVITEHYDNAVIRIPTRIAKLVVTGKGGAKKDEVASCLFNDANINTSRFKPEETADHETDSWAVGVAWYKTEYLNIDVKEFKIVKPKKK